MNAKRGSCLERKHIHRQLYDRVRDDCDTGFFRILDPGFVYFDQIIHLLATSMPRFVGDPIAQAQAELLFYIQKKHPLYCYLEKGVALFLMGYSPIHNDPHRLELIPLVMETNLPNQDYPMLFLEWIEDLLALHHAQRVFHIFVIEKEQESHPLRDNLLQSGYQVIDSHPANHHRLDLQLQMLEKHLQGKQSPTQ